MIKKDNKGFIGYYAACTLLGFVLGCDYKEPVTKGSKDEKPVISETSKKTLPDIVKTYSKHKPVVYLDFPEIDFDSIPVERIKMPSNLKEMENEYRHKPKISDAEKLENLVLSEASKLDYDKIDNLSIEDAVRLGIKIVTSRLEYYSVDLDHDFIAKHGAHLPIDKYLEIGLGDCDKYSYALMAVMDVIKKHNSNLENIYVNEVMGAVSGLTEEGKFVAGFHSWNSLVFLTEDKVILSEIDLTWHDSGDDLQVKRGVHIPENDQEIIAQFYKNIYNFEDSYRCYLQALDDVEDSKEKAGILSDMAYTACQLDDKSKMDRVRKQYLELDVQTDLDSILYYSYMVEEKVGNPDKAAQFKQELINKFPDSFWVEIL